MSTQNLGCIIYFIVYSKTSKAYIYALCEKRPLFSFVKSDSEYFLFTFFVSWCVAEQTLIYYSLSSRFSLDRVRRPYQIVVSTSDKADYTRLLPIIALRKKVSHLHKQTEGVHIYVCVLSVSSK